MFLLFFLLWLLLSGGVSVHTCLWGAAASALITWFCRRVLGYEWHILLGDPRRLWAMARYFAHLLVEMLKAGLVVVDIPGFPSSGGGASRSFKLTYKSSQSYAMNAGRTFAKLSVKFNEANPADTGDVSGGGV